MGKLEVEVQNQIRNTKIQKVVLQTVAAAGLLSVALLAPNALQMLSIFKGSKLLKNKRHSINLSRDRLVRNGLLTYNHEGYLQLTRLGEKQLRRIEAANYQLKKPKKWDGKWRVLIFDISEKRKPTREKVRATLAAIGFVRLQDSVWVYPYGCEDLITLLKADFKIGKDLLYIIADKIENDVVLRKKFDLARKN